jgi:RND family efflux transporter MFP subunit
VEERLAKTVIVAPFDCTVLTRPVSIGQAVSGSGGFNSGTEVLTIADLNQMIINAHVNQVDVTRLSVGQQVDIEVESVPGLTMRGTVERIAPQSTIKNSIKGYSARVRIDEIDPRVRPGMTANVSIPVASSEDALAVPLAAVFTEQGERYAYVQKGDTFERRPLQIGISDYDYAEVLKGLQPGDVVSLEDQALKLGRPPGDRAAGPATFGTRPGEKPAGSPLARPAGEQAPRGGQSAEARPSGSGGSRGGQTTTRTTGTAAN